MEIEFSCADCKHANQVETEQNSSEISCSACRRNYGLTSDFADAGNIVQKCGICGCRDLFIQKDFSRKVGCTIAAIGAILAPFTKLISLFVCALIDLILYRILPVITICYRCGAIYREFKLNPDHESFNLGINDRYRAAERPL